MLWAQGNTNTAVRLERRWDDVAKQHELEILFTGLGSQT